MTWLYLLAANSLLCVAFVAIASAHIAALIEAAKKGSGT